MTRSEVLAFVQRIKPHEFENEVMLRWLDELERKIAAEIHGKFAREERFVALSAEQLSVPAPYDRVYWTYLVSMIDLVTGTPETYAFSSGVFKEAYGEYARFVQRQSGCRRRRSLC